MEGVIVTKLRPEFEPAAFDWSNTVPYAYFTNTAFPAHGGGVQRLHIPDPIMEEIGWTLISISV